MRVAVVGAGLTGLGLSYYLLEKGHQVTLFDQEGVGGGASGISAGLLHPYVGKKGLRSRFADEALQEAYRLLEAVQAEHSESVLKRNGMYRLFWENPPLDYGDIDYRKQAELGLGLGAWDCYYIHSGATVFMRNYLEGLFQYLMRRGMHFEKVHFSSLKHIADHDATAYCLGSGLRHFSRASSLPIKFVKGQIITCKVEEKLERSVIGEGHISITEDPSEVQIGGTYEHHFKDLTPDLDAAIRYFDKRITKWAPHWKEFEILSCKAEARVCQKEGYLPLIHRLATNVWMLTAMGSRGLLYHAMYGRNLANLIESHESS